MCSQITNQIGFRSNVKNQGNNITTVLRLRKGLRNQLLLLNYQPFVLLNFKSFLVNESAPQKKKSNDDTFNEFQRNINYKITSIRFIEFK